MRTTTRTILALSLLAGAPLGAQGVASVQGFGYPTGQLGARAGSTGGALTEFDETTPLNPATVLGWQAAGLHFQYEPEFRTNTVPGGTFRTVANRIPVVVAALPLGSRAALALSLSSLLDRTWATSSVSRQSVGAESLYVSQTSSSDGGMNDIRLALGWSAAKWVSVGVAAHAMVGLDRFTQTVVLSRADPRTTTTTSSEFSPYGQQADIRFSGSALSAGVLLRPYRTISLGVSGRMGQSVRLTRRDSLVARADIPNRLGAGLAYEVAARTLLAADVEWIGWSALAPLSTDSKPHDALGWSAGIEAPGPRFAGRALTVRAGFHHRPLAYDAPTAVNGSNVQWGTVEENAYTAGLSAPFAYDRALLTIFGQRATRSVAGEKSFTLGVGLTVRP
ncbi:MAG: hypothetical protein HOQ26_17050 [Gemmatimonadaceae bacterium]|nr:hypothetical protein [Gemmatimonadaceae bacterium]NUQ94608.1 hypothetical protein [Gemmatimonadaceae bacterium]